MMDTSPTFVLGSANFTLQQGHGGGHGDNVVNVGQRMHPMAPQSSAKYVVEESGSVWDRFATLQW